MPLMTHVLDIADGKATENVGNDLFAFGDEREHVTTVVVSNDGRTDTPLLDSALAGAFTQRNRVLDPFVLST